MSSPRKLGIGFLVGGLSFLIAVVIPIVIARVLVPERGIEGALTASGLDARMKDRGFDLQLIAKGQLSVPRVYAARFPSDWKMVKPSARRKNLFVAVMLPLVLRENERILEDRAQLKALLHQNKWSPREHRWLKKQGNRYGVRLGEWTDLLNRMDSVPPGLALAQAVIESGWGGSRFALEGNAVFGQWTHTLGQGMVPQKRAPGASHEIKKFRNLGESVAAYLGNLNTHPAYAEFRVLRSERRHAGQPMSGPEAALTLIHYSETGNDYIRLLSDVMASNGLNRFDTTKLTSAKRF